MTRAPRSAVGAITGWGLLALFRNRVLAFGLPIVVCVVLALFPQRFRAVSTLTPTDPASLGLSGTLGQLGAAANVFGNQAAIEVAMRVGDSQDVRSIVIKQTKLEQRLGKDEIGTQRWLSRNVDVRSLRGGIIQIDMKNRDAALAEDVVAAYTVAIRDRLSQISREQTSYKREILENLVREASGKLADAQRKYDTYRLEHREAVPETQTSLVADRIGSLEGAIRGKRVTLSIARQMYTDENFEVRQIKAEIAALERQLVEAKATNPSDPQSVGSVVASTTILFNLQRELGLQRGLYESYMRFLQGTSVENLTSSANVRILEPPHIDSERQYWLPAIAAGLALALLWGAIEFYRLRPPLGAPIGGRDVSFEPAARSEGPAFEAEHG